MTLLKISSLKHFKFILPLVLLFAGHLQAQPLVDGIVAVVGKNIVLKSDVDQQIQNLERQGEDIGEKRRCKVFEDLLFEKLLLHQSEIDSVTVTDEQVEQTIDRRIQVFIQQIGSKQKLEQYYDKTVLEIKEEMTPLIRDQMRAQMMMREITGDVKITPAEVRQYFRNIPEDSLPLVDEEIEYAQIKRYPEVSPEAEKEAIERLSDLKKRIQEGSSFSSMAVLYSEDPGSARKGGKYEGIKRGQFVDEFEAVAFNLKEGEISDPFKSEFGYHIIQLIKKRGQELDLRHILIKPKISQENLNDTKEFMDSVRTQILTTDMDFEEAAKRFSDDEKSRLNGGLQINPNTGDSRWPVGELKKNVFYGLESLDEGEISEALFFREQDGKEGYRLLKLISKTKAHRASLEQDYQRLQQLALEKKKQKVIQDWIQEKIQDTYVRVNNEYFNCEFSSNWIKESQYVE